jgi:hypothetical protein
MPQTRLTAFGGSLVDNITGLPGNGLNIQATIPLRFSHLEIRSTFGFQKFRVDLAGGPSKTLFVERHTQITATWHFSSRLNLRAIYQVGAFDAAPPFAGMAAASRTVSNASSLLLSYQTNWQTRYYVGASWTSSDSEPVPSLPDARDQIFAKISYAFSN